MSSIPNAKMKHAHVPVEGDTPPATEKKPKGGQKLTDRVRDLGGRAQDLAEDAVEVVKAHPKAAAGIAGAVVAGAAALVGVATGVFRSDDKAQAAKKSPPAKKAAAKKKG